MKINYFDTPEDRRKYGSAWNVLSYIFTGKNDNSPEEVKPEAGAVMSVDEAEDLYYQSHTCISDDADAEQGRIERWCEDMNITVTD